MKAKILIVDDEAELRDSLARHFRLDGYAVDTAADGADALTKLSSAPYSVVISDIMMPIMDGIDLLRRVKSEYPMVRVIMITGYVTLGNALSCMRHGADTCVFKPLVDLAELDGAVLGALAHLANWQSKFLELKGIK
jgi:DNA-binding NtrC family response regulator